MPDDTPLTGADIEEYESLEELTQSHGWRYLKKIFNTHRIFCLEEMRKKVKRHEDRMAGEWLARSEEPQHLISMIQARKKELFEKRKGD